MVKNEVVVKNVLITLLQKWNHVAIIIEERKDLFTLDYDQLIGLLMSHEERLQESTSSNVGDVEEKAFASKEAKAIASGYGRGQDQGRDQSYSREKGRGRRGVSLKGKGRGIS